MRVTRKQCEHGERSDEEEGVSNGSWKRLSKVQDDCNIQEEMLDEAVDESASTDDEYCHDHENEVHKD